MHVINNRYEIIDTLYSNVAGTIYKVVDKQNPSMHLRLKLLSKTYSHVGKIQHISESFHEWKTLRHPYIDSVYEFDIVEKIDGKEMAKGRFFYTFEDRDYSHVIEYYELNDDEKIDVIASLCKAVAYLHSRGFVHGNLDFKTMTILRDVQGKISLKLKNMAFASLYDDIYFDSGSNFVEMIAPEIFFNETVTAEVDVYALGILIYYIRYSEIRHELSINKINKSNSKDPLMTILKKAVKNDPNHRYANATEMWHEIKVLFALEDDPLDFQAYNRLNFDIPMIGQNSIIDYVTDQIQNNTNGYSEFMMFSLYGERGIGKSQSLREIAYRLRLMGYRTIYTQLTSHDEKPFKTFSMLVDEMMSYNYNQNDYVEKYGSEFVKILPHRSEQWNVKAAHVSNEKIENHKLVNRIITFMDECSFEEPLVLVIDNIEYLSEYEKKIVYAITSSEKVLSIYILCTYDDDNELSWKNNIRHKGIYLPPLNYDEQTQYVKKMLGQEDGTDVITATILKDIHGSPYKIQNLLTDWFEEKRIYVDENMKWKIKTAPMFYSAVSKDSICEFPKELSAIIEDASQQQIFELMAIAGEAVYQISIENVFSNLDAQQIADVLEKAENIGFLDKTVGDFGYAYSYKHKKLLLDVVNSISYVNKKRYHKMVADILMRDYAHQLGIVGDRLIYHLIESRYVEKSVEICQKASAQVEKMYFYQDAIHFLEEAININHKYDLKINESSILNRMGHLHEKINQLDEAKQCFEIAQKTAQIQHDDIEYINASLELCLLQTGKYKTSQSLTMLEKLKQMSINIQYDEGELRAQDYILVVCYDIGAFDNKGSDIKDYIRKAEEFDNQYFLARFYTAWAVYSSLKGQYFESSKYINKALVIYEQQNAIYDQCKLYNTMGEIYALAYGDINYIRENYMKAYKLSKKTRILQDRNKYLYNIGSTYMLEQKFGDAMKYFTEARLYTKSAMLKEYDFRTLYRQCEIYICTGDYSRAHKMFSDITVLYNDIPFNEHVTRIYYALASLYACFMKDVDAILNMLDRYMAISSITLGENAIQDPMHHYIMKNMEFWIWWYENGKALHSPNEILNKIKDLILIVHDSNGARIVRQIIFIVGIFIAEEGRYMELKRYLDLDSKLISYYDSKFLSTQREILTMALTELDVIKLRKLLFDETMDLNEEWLVFVYKKLGDQLKSQSLYEALAHYFKAFESIQRMTENLSDDEIRYYIMFDNVKLNLRYEMDLILNELGGNYNNGSVWHDLTLEDFSSKQYFDITSLDKLYENNNFLESLKHSYMRKYGEYFDDFNALVCDLSDDLEQNMYKFMILCIKETLADVACLYIQDTVTDSWKIIKSDQSFNMLDISSLIRKAHVYREGVLRIGKKLNKNLGKNNRFTVSMILLPILSIDYAKNSDSEKNLLEEKIIGYLYLESDPNFNRFNESVLSNIRKMMNLCSMLIQNYSLQRQVRIDKLTGVYLRSFMEEKFSAEFTNLYLENRQLSLVMLDIDNFKGINDRFGHRCGDAILKKIGNIMNKLVRTVDFVSRYGGDEFLIFLPDADADFAQKILRQIHSEVQEKVFVGNFEKVTLSVGIASYPKHASSEEELIEKADQALYHSKKYGKNMITVWNETMKGEIHPIDRPYYSIIRGDVNDANRVDGVMALIDLLSSKKPKNKMDKALSIILDELGADEVVIIGKDKKDGILYSKSIDEDMLINYKEYEIMYDKYRQSSGAIFIDWENPIIPQYKMDKTDWKSKIIIPLNSDENLLGLLFIAVSILKMEFTDRDYVLAKSLSILLTKMFEQSME